MLNFISAIWTSTVLPLVRLLLPEIVVAAAVSVGVIDTVWTWFYSPAIFLPWIVYLSSNAAMYSIAAVLDSVSDS